MINKKYIILGMFLILAIAGVSLVSAGDVCCEQLKDGAWCQNAGQEQCAIGVRTPPTSCDQTSFCKLGTCINTNKGTCMPNTPKVLCESEGGTWEDKDKDEIAMCQNGCCMFGEDVSFITNAECQQLASDYGVDVDFRADIQDQFSCFDLSYTKEKGACVFGDYVKDCSFISKEDCVGILDSTFNPGLLCTASGLSDCAKSSRTKCQEDQVYFLDTCGNLANIYDSRMYTSNENQWTKAMEDYWTYVKEPECSVSGANADCGACEFRGGTVCSEFKRGEEGMPKNSPVGDHVCRDIGCYYDVDNDGNKEKYSHGESVCAESEGTYFHTPRIDIRSDSLRTKLSDITKYNLPGSRYYKLECWNGEMIVEPCREYRNEICEETEVVEDFTVANCIVNDWRMCFEIVDRDDCEDDVKDCKWIPGYRFDFKEVEQEYREDEQGSCVPLYTPGYDFWSAESDAHALCVSGMVLENVAYETHWLVKRDNFKDWSTINPAQRCLENCYAIPDYGSDLALQQVMNYYKGNELQNSKDYHISKRQGHYCTKKDDPDKKKLGPTDDKVNCAGNDDKKRVPLFYTHKQWLDAIKIRAKSLGDCGVKDNIQGKPGQDGSELITVVFQQLKQDGSPKGDNGTIETIWIGDKKIFGYRSVDGSDIEADLDKVEPSWTFSNDYEKYK